MPSPQTSYYGRILTGPCSRMLKDRVRQCIRSFDTFENTGVPSIPYISAWHPNKRDMWYEYVGRGLSRLFNCQPDEVARLLRNSIIDRHNYHIDKHFPHIEKQSIDRDTLEKNRDRLRFEGQQAGFVDAVYKLALGGEKTIWLKDLAIIEPFPADDICLSLGCLTVVTKEMRAEEERLVRERLQVSLQMAGGVCHELNQPLQVISGYAESLLSTLRPEDPNYDAVQKIIDSAAQMGTITGKLMHITKYETKDYLQGIKIVDLDRASGKKPR